MRRVHLVTFLLVWGVFCWFYARSYAGIFFVNTGHPFIAGPTPTPSPTPPPTGCDYFVDNSATGCGGGGCADGNAGTSLATAWLTLSKVNATDFGAGKTVCLVGQTTPNTTNGGIWREQLAPSSNTKGTGWGDSNQVTFSSYDTTKLAIITGSKCYGAATNYCVGSTPITWTKCTSGVAPCNSGAGITNVYYYARPTAVAGSVYVDSPDVVGTSNIWADQTKFLLSASCLPGSCSTSANKYQGGMTAGTWYDDGTYLFIWMSDASDPSTHTIEATTNNTAQGIIQANVSSGHRDWIVYTYLKLLYTATTAANVVVGNATDGLHLKYDHMQVGGTGAGPVTNGGSGFYTMALYAKGSSNANTTDHTLPIQLVAGSEVWITNNTVNNCGSHNCIDVDGFRGPLYIQNNIAGTAEHHQIDVKCPYNVTESGNYTHDGWTGVIAGSDTEGLGAWNHYTEVDWDSCAGGSVTFTNNTGSNVTEGMACLANIVGTQICKFYNNTIILNGVLGTPTFHEAGFNAQANSGDSLTFDVRNNIVYTSNANDYGYQRSTSGGTYNQTEGYNLYYNTTGINTNKINTTSYTTLSGWQATGLGTGDQWQFNPLFVSLTPSNNLLPICLSSPGAHSGTGSVGTSTTMGADPTLQNCSQYSTLINYPD